METAINCKNRSSIDQHMSEKNRDIISDTESKRKKEEDHSA
jgi:hypothetical protein